MGDQPNWPTWATQLKGRNDQIRIHHVFDLGFKREQIDKSHDVVIIGAGMSSAQLALSLLDANQSGQITIVSRHNLRQEDFDSSPGWLGPRLLTAFHQEKDIDKRRAIIQQARKNGSLASEVMRRMQTAVKNKTIRFKLAEIDSASYEPINQRLRLDFFSIELDETEYKSKGEIVSKLSEETQSIEVDTIILATGFEAKPPGGKLVEKAILEMNLPTSKSGFPILDIDLRWREGLFVMGSLAELEIGPVSRNLSGARMAAERIMKSIAMNSKIR